MKTTKSFHTLHSGVKNTGAKHGRWIEFEWIDDHWIETEAEYENNKPVGNWVSFNAMGVIERVAVCQKVF